MNHDRISWDIINTYFKANPDYLIKHQVESYDDFFEHGIPQLLREKNPIKIMKGQNPDTKEFKYEASLYFGGKTGNKLYYGKPIIYDQDDRVHFMYPNEARLRNMTYGISIHYDVEVEYTIRDEEGVPVKTTGLLEKVFLGRFPVMLQSNLCILRGLAPEVRFNMGECRNDPGGYFIIGGNEKVIVSQEKFADNMLYVRDKFNDMYSHSAEIRSVSEDAAKPIRTFGLRIVSDTPTTTQGQIVAVLPNVRKPIPLFILMRALGIVSDKDIILHCLLNLEDYSSYVELFRPSVYNAGYIYTREAAIKYIATLTKGKTVYHATEILMNYLLPHIGELNFQDKALFIGYMTRRLLMVYTKESKATDRDSFKYKRIENAGTLLRELFREYYNLQQKHIYTKIDKEYFYHEGLYQKDFHSLIEANTTEYFKERMVEVGFRKAFKGNWGAQEHTKRPGVVQELSRLSFNSFVAQLRKVNLSMDSSAKVVKPRLLNSTQWGIIDPIDTPDGGNCGLHKHLAIMTVITSRCSGYPFAKLLRDLGMQLLIECSIEALYRYTKVFVNGAWLGIVSNPIEVYDILRAYKRNGVLPVFVSIRWHHLDNELIILTDGGRPSRPLFYVDNGSVSYESTGKKDLMLAKKYTWSQLLVGLSKSDASIRGCEIGDTRGSCERLRSTAGVIEYVDTEEAESAMIVNYVQELEGKPRTTHVEIHPSLIFGVMGNQIVFPENNQLPRNLFACGQSKQAVSLYNSNYQNRMDKASVILNYGQIPLVKTRYLKYISGEEHPYGENAIVAIMCFSGYNVEDSVLVNKASLDRGLFRTTYFSTYESREESDKVAGSVLDSRFMNVEKHAVVGKRPGFDYSQLDEHGLIKENVSVTDKSVLIGKAMNSIDETGVFIDMSTTPKKGQVGYVDRVFMTEGEEGFRLSKVRIRSERIPAIGDKVCSRCGQKGTIGLVVSEEDMPFTAHGTRPDIIVNPHAFPSRMTIAQLIETVMGKACAIYGGFGDGTAFVNKGPTQQLFGEMLTRQGFNSSGNEVLYNGQSGEQLEAAVYIGPTYYMRLKHMVKDKINYRARGPRTVLTRQAVQGRANDGGLRVGEMERDGIIAHGMSGFLAESMLTRGDEYFMAICNMSGTIAIYNSDKNIFLSPMTDGPIKFAGSLEDELNVVNVSKFGRSFSVVRVPYSFKLLMQELRTMNVQMHIITNDNVDQLTSMGYSNDYTTLSGKDLLSDVGRAGHVKPVDKKKRPSRPAQKKPTAVRGEPAPDYTAVAPPPEDVVDPDEAWLAARLPGGILAEQEAPSAYSPPEHRPERSSTPDYGPPKVSFASPQYRPQSPDYPPPESDEQIPYLESVPSIEYDPEPQFIPIEEYEALKKAGTIVEPKKIETIGGSEKTDMPLLKTIEPEIDVSANPVGGTKTVKIEIK